MQSRTMSFVEACANIAIGFGINLAGQLVIYPRFHIHISLAANIGIGIFFTALSLARSYALRRLFNRAPVPPGFGPLRIIDGDLS